MAFNLFDFSQVKATPSADPTLNPLRSSIGVQKTDTTVPFAPWVKPTYQSAPFDIGADVSVSPDEIGAMDAEIGITEAEMSEMDAMFSEVAKPEEKSFASRFKLESSESFAAPEIAKDVAKFFINVPADSLEVVEELGRAALNPIDTVSGLVKTGKGLSDKAVFSVANAIARQFGGKDVPPTEEAKMIDAIGDKIKQDYGTAGKFKKAVVENPADVLLTVMGGLGVAKDVAKANNLTNAVSKIEKLEKVVNPLNVMKKEAELVKWIAKPLVSRAVEAWKSVLPKTGVSKLESEIAAKTTPAIVGNKKVLIEKPDTGLIGKAVKAVTPEVDPARLADRALTPSYAGKTAKQNVGIIRETEKNVRSLWEKVKTGELSGNLDSLQDAAETVVKGIDDTGKRIGALVKDATGKVSMTDDFKQSATTALANRIEKRAGAYEPLKRFTKDLAKPLSIQDAMKAKRVYQSEITKLIRSWDAGTDSFSALVNWVEELSKGIDNAVAATQGWAGFAKLKSDYAIYKKLVDIMSKSAVVDARRSPMTLTEQIGTLETIVEGVRNPLSTAKNLFAREIGEMNTRGGAWKTLMDHYANEAIKKAKSPILKPASKPKPKSPALKPKVSK